MVRTTIYRTTEIISISHISSIVTQRNYFKCNKEQTHQSKVAIQGQRYPYDNTYCIVCDAQNVGVYLSTYSVDNFVNKTHQH